MKAKVIDLSKLTPTTVYLLHDFGESVRMGRRLDPEAPGSMDDDAAGAPLLEVIRQLEREPRLEFASQDELMAFARLVGLTIDLLGETIEDLAMLVQALDGMGARRAA